MKNTMRTLMIFLVVTITFLAVSSEAVAQIAM